MRSKNVCIFIVVEAWQPPRQAHLSFVQELRKTIGPASNIVVFLLGDNESENREAWRRKISALGDPYVRVEGVGA